MKNLLLKHLLLVIILLVYAPGLFPQSVINPGLSLQELVYDADAILYGQVVQKDAKWISEHMIATDYHFVLYDTIFKSSYNTFLSEEKFVLRLAGGVVGNTGLEVGNIPFFDVGDEVVLFLDEENRHSISALVGVYQGYIMVEEFQGTKRIADKRFSDIPLEKNEKPSQDVTTFLSELKQQAHQIKANKQHDWRERRSSNSLHRAGQGIPPHSLFDHSQITNTPINTEDLTEVRSSPDRVPDIGHTMPFEPGQIAHPKAVISYPARQPDKFILDRVPPTHNFAWNITPQLTDNGAPWGINFEYACSDWNRYASNIFVKLANPSFRIGLNGTNDVLFLTPDLYKMFYFEEMPTTMLALAKRYFTIATDQIEEVDIVFNIEKQWTVDFETAYNSTDIFSFRSVAIHEIGHAFGINHPWEGSFDQYANSVMAYQSNNKIRTLISRPHGMDAWAARHAYSHISNNISDYGVYLYHTTPGIGNMYWSAIPSSVVQGNSFTIENVVIENLGTTFDLRGVNFFLTTHRNTHVGATNYYLGLRLVSVNVNEYNKYDFTFTAPLTVPFGHYYILADIGYDDHDFNRYAWSDRRITVISAPNVSITPESTVFEQTVIGKCSGNATFVLSNSGGALAKGSISLTGANAADFSIVSGGGSFNLVSGNERIITVSFCPEKVGNKAATLMISGTDGTNSVSATLTGTACQLPSTPASIAGETLVCSRIVQLYSIAPVTGATSYTWQYGGQGSITGTGTRIDLTPISSGILRVRAHNNCGSGNWQTLSITVQDPPEDPGPIAGPTAVSFGRNYQYSISSVKDAETYNWSYSGNSRFTSNTGATIAMDIFSGGILSISVTSKCGTSTTGTLQVTAHETSSSLTPGNTEILSGESGCFSAFINITLAKDDFYFSVETGGNAIFIAGETIRMLPGTRFQTGSQVHAWIAPGGPFCGEPDKQMVAVENEVEVKVEVEVEKNEFFSVYPNPTLGRFTLEMINNDNQGHIVVEVYGIRGERVLREELPADLHQHELSLEGLVPGIYIVRVVSGQKAAVGRIIKR